MRKKNPKAASALLFLRPRKKVQDFWSHSWRTPAWKKVGLLLFWHRGRIRAREFGAGIWSHRIDSQQVVTFKQLSVASRLNWLILFLHFPYPQVLWLILMESGGLSHVSLSNRQAVPHSGTFWDLQPGKVRRHGATSHVLSGPEVRTSRYIEFLGNKLPECISRA